jgi:alpha-tubulin suppressor-like RCC1 family protein
MAPRAVTFADTSEGGTPGARVAQGRIAAGFRHTCAITDDGTVTCFGYNSFGELGSITNNGTGNPNPTPQPPIGFGPGRTATAITAGGNHMCALLDNGLVRCWGFNRYGQLGAVTNNNTSNPNPTPQPPVNLGAGRTATAITAGANHTCALLDNGTVRCWGFNRYGQLGAVTNNNTNDPNPTPQPPVNLGAGRTATAITAGANHTCALLDNGTVRCFGYNFSGQLGSTTNSGTSTPNPTPRPPVNLGTGRTATAVTAGSDHTCALLDNGTVRCVGYNVGGQLGSTTNNGTGTPNPTPEPAIPLGRPTTAITAGANHTCALLDNGTVRCVGSNRYGELGSPTNNGTTDANPTPEPAIPFGRPASAITAGANHTCALLDDDTVRCVGNNRYGELGSTTNNNTGNPNPTPQPAVPGLVVSGDDLRAVFTSLTPARFADSRNEPTFDGQFRNTGPRGGGSVWQIKIAGRGNVPAAATAAIVNLTITGATRNGFATIYPCGPVPAASSINYTAGVTTANEAITKLSPTGTICIYTHTRAHVIVDVAGHATNSAYQPLAPRRFADSRDQPTFDNTTRNTGRRQAGTVWEIPIRGRGGITASTAAAVVNLTITGATRNGFATIYACGTRPGASSINYTSGTSRANEVIVKLSPTGRLCIYAHTQAHVIIDVVGLIDQTARRYTATTPTRYADSRDEPTFDLEFRNTGPRNAGTTWQIDVRGRGTVPTNAQAVAVNLTVTSATSNGFATIYPCGTRPNASSINYTPGTSVANELITKLSPTGTICIYTHTQAHVIADIVGHTT